MASYKFIGLDHYSQSRSCPLDRGLLYKNWRERILENIDTGKEQGWGYPNGKDDERTKGMAKASPRRVMVSGHEARRIRHWRKKTVSSLTEQRETREDMARY